MSGECAQGEEGSEQHPVRKGPLKNDLWDLVEEVEEN
jgi:hypothetical protein